MIVADQNRYNNLLFDLLPLVYLEFRHARFMVWFHLVRFIVETSCFDGGIRIIGIEKQKNIILWSTFHGLCKRECDVMYTYRKKFSL